MKIGGARAKASNRKPGAFESLSSRAGARGASRATAGAGEQGGDEAGQAVVDFPSSYKKALAACLLQTGAQQLKFFASANPLH